jgi:hypothetical protein
MLWTEGDKVMKKEARGNEGGWRRIMKEISPRLISAGFVR